MHTQGKNADLGYGVTDSFSFSIGLGHDGDNNCTNGVNIMSTVLPGGTGALKWSSCSRHVLQGFLRFVLSLKMRVFETFLYCSYALYQEITEKFCSVK